uniref:Glycosyl transferase family 25 domain-containing protein n=1 Tax=viral metagenome TaxID=1070528 RepID=A0A6C0D4X5_9ZZZZ
MKKNNNYLYIFILFIVVSIILLYILFFRLSCKKKENFANPEITNDNIKIYVITLRQEQRMINIKNQEKKIKEKIEIMDAVKGDTLNISELLGSGLLSESYKDADKIKKREIGCYMSHMNLYNLIKTNNMQGYTLILEDDCNFLHDNFMDILKESLSKLRNYDFDLLYLGNHNNNHGELVVDNIYKTNNNEHLIGTHCYVVNNKNIDKIIASTKFIDSPIDIKIDYLCKKNEIIVLVIYPIIANQGGSTYSSIQDLNVPQIN